MSDKTDRRGFLTLVSGLAGAALAATVGGPVAAAFLGTAKKRTISGASGPTALAKLSELKIGEPVKRDVVAERNDAWDRSDAKAIGAVWLIRRDEHKVDAFSVSCPHLGCPIVYDGANKEFACPCHNSAFSVDDGHCKHGPAPRGLDPLEVDLKGDAVMVTFKRFVQGISSRREA